MKTKKTDNFISDLVKAEVHNDLALAVELVLADWKAWNTYSEPIKWNSLKTLEKISNHLRMKEDYDKF